MNFRPLVLATTLTLASAASQAALVTLSAPEWPPIPSSGLETVQFNRVANGDGQMVALGAHGYKNGPTLPNDGIKIFTAQPGTYPGTPDRANWSFDFSYNLGNCTACGVYLRVDTDPGAGTTFSELQLNASPFPYGGTGNDSWNLEMGFFNVLLSYDFNPFTSSSTAFELVIRNAAGGPDVLATDILVNVNAVPEPGSFALLGLGLAGLAVMRRRKA